MEAKNQGIIQAKALWRSTLVVRENGELWSCGYGYCGVLFTGDEKDRLTPVLTAENVKLVDGIQMQAGMVKTNGDVYCVGLGPVGNGQLGIQIRPQLIIGDAKYLSCKKARFVIRTDDTLWAWGSNAYNGLFTDTKGRELYSPTKVKDGISVAKGSITNGYLLTKSGELWSTGNNRYGQIGDGTTTRRYEAVKIMDGIKDFEQSGSYIIALAENGDVYTFGAGKGGALGTGDTNDQPLPVKIMGSCKSVTCYGGCCFAIHYNGDLYGWGSNTTGQLGDTTSRCRLAPVKIMEQVAAVSANEHVLAIKENGEVWVWGSNSRGAFGDGTILPGKTYSPPVPFLLPID